jgi:hypothetical protein
MLTCSLSCAWQHITLTIGADASQSLALLSVLQSQLLTLARMVYAVLSFYACDEAMVACVKQA